MSDFERTLAIVGSVASVIGFWMAWRALVGVKRQLEVESFLGLTERYDQIMSQVPRSVIRGHAAQTLSDVIPVPDEIESVEKALDRYFNLCSQEFVLMSKGVIGKDVWALWERRLKHLLSIGPIRHHWDDMKFREELCSAEFHERVKILLNA